MSRPALAFHARSLPDMVYRRLREAILDCTLEPGCALRQGDIATQHGVSRLPVREAMRRLESEGLVVSRPRRGFIVAYVSHSEILDVFDARAVLEAHGGYLATQVRTGKDVTEVERLLDESSEALLGRKKDIRRFFELNVRFHDRLLWPLDRPHLKRMITTLRNAGERYIRMSVKLSDDLTPSTIEHRLMYEAYAAGDADEMARLSHDHCTATMRRLLGNLENRGFLMQLGSPVHEAKPFRGGLIR